MDIWQNTSLCDCDMTQKLVQLLIVADSKLEMARNDTSLFVIARSIASKFQNFSGQILKHSC